MESTPENSYVLYLKTGRQGSGPSACPCCHHAFMLSLFKVNGGGCTITVRYVNPNKPPEDVRQIAKRLPALVDTRGDPTETTAQYDELSEFFEQRVPNPQLIPDDKEAIDVTLNLFSKFTYFLRNLSTTPQYLETELERVDTFFRRHADDRCYLCGNFLSDLDCQIMPKLHQIRVACAALKGYEIPTRFQHIWRYLNLAYSNPCFRRACPSDEEIIYHCGQKMEGKSNLPKHVRNIINNSLDCRELETYSFNVLT